MGSTQWFFTFVLSAFLANAQQIPPGCDVTTTTGYRYSNFHHLHANPDGTMELRFRVMAKSDAHIALTTSPLVLNPLYEIVIGASGNNYTDLRRTMTGRSVSAVRTPMLLSDSEFRGFWVKVRDGEIEVGKEGDTLPYFHWKDPDGLPVHYYSLSSWTGTVAKWIQKCNFGGPTSWLSPSDNSSSDDAAALTPQSRDFYNVEEKLKSNLLQAYNRDIRPSAYHRTPVTVSVSMTLLHFDITEVSSRVDMFGWLRLSWRDPRLAWNETDYENVTLVHLTNHLIWQPDIRLYNSASATDAIHSSETTALVYSDGSVVIVPPTSFDTLCLLDLRYWPYDTQTCKFVVGSWAHSGQAIDLQLHGATNTSSMEGNMDTEDMLAPNLHWELLSATSLLNVSYYPCCPDESYPTVQFRLTVQRRSPLYRATVIAPAVVIAFLTLASFLLPPNSTEKVIIGMVNLLIISFFLIYFSAILPPLGDHMPVIVAFYSDTLVLATVSVIIAVITMTMVRTMRLQGLPYSLKNILVGLPGRFLGLSNIILLVKQKAENHDTEPHQQRMDEYNLHVDADHDTSAIATPDRKKLFSIRGLETMALVDLEWLLLAYVLDRLALVIYIFSFAILTLLYL